MPEIACSEERWIELNESSYTWYYSNYPLIESGIRLPVSFERLKLFYITDMRDRNFEPQQAWLNCYHNLFSYLLGRITGVINVEGTNWFERLINAFPVALTKTYEQITSPFGVPLWIWLGGALAAVVVLKS